MDKEVYLIESVTADSAETIVYEVQGDEIKEIERRPLSLRRKKPAKGEGQGWL